jgi:hypothetical protein
LSKNTRNLTKAAEILSFAFDDQLPFKSARTEMVPLIERHKGQKNISLTPEGEDFISIA